MSAEPKTNLDKTMDGKKLPSGDYITSVVSEANAANILFITWGEWSRKNALDALSRG